MTSPLANPLANLDVDWSGLDGYQPIEAVLIIEALDEEGDVVLMHCASKGLKSWKALGMTMYTSDTLRRKLQEEEE